MGKRDIAAANGVTEDGGPRNKRRKESTTVTISLKPPAASSSRGGNSGKSDALSLEEVKEQGLRWWQVLKDATNKDGRNISHDFLRQPPKRLYPDYYLQIKHPIALENIKKKLEAHGYKTLENIKSDFDLCFSNARAYNIEESVIWNDAKQLQRLINKEYTKVVGGHENGANEGNGSGDHESKHKSPSLTKMLKSRLNKLKDITDADGRVRSEIFQVLPSPVDWAIYYQQIKRPIALDGIFKRLKHKEYGSSLEFADDVELLFQNAMDFNQEGTQIYLDAVFLRDEFRRLMSDLPPPHTLEKYSRPAGPKIKLKVPALAQPTPVPTVPTISLPPAVKEPFKKPPEEEKGLQPPPPPPPKEALPPNPAPAVTAPVTAAPKMSLRSKAITASTPAAPTTPSTPTPTTKQAPPPAPTLALPVAPARGGMKEATPPAPAIAVPKPQIPVPALPVISKVPLAVPTLTTPRDYTSSPANATASSSTPRPLLPKAAPPPPPVAQPNQFQLRSVTVVTDPRGRKLSLDHRDGVTCWAIRLGIKESSLIIRNIQHFPQPEDQEGEHSEDEAEASMDVDGAETAAPVKNGRSKKKGKGRAQKPSTVVAAKQKDKQAKRIHIKPEDIHVKLNGNVVKQMPAKQGQWHVSIPIGLNTVEIGELLDGGFSWKVFAQRIADI